MKITNQYWAARFAHEEHLQHIFVESMMQKAPYHFDEETLKVRRDSMRLVSLPAEKNFLVSKKVQAMASTIRFEKIEPKVFLELPLESAALILDKYRFFRIEKVEDKILAAYFYPYVDTDKSQPLEEMGLPNVRYNTFVLDAAGGEIHFSNHNQEVIPEERRIVDHQIEKQKLLWQILTFMFYAEPEMIVVEPDKKITLDASLAVENNKVLNESLMDVTLVASDWNRVTIVAGGFEVRGHLRFQAYGKGFSERKLIWIDSFQKHGYVRGRRSEEKF